jgi:hypothetical protein
VTGSAGFGAAGVLSGYVRSVGDSGIEFNSAFIEDSTALGSNSALKGLSDVAGHLYLYGGSAVWTTGALASDGIVLIDFFEGGSSLTVAGR